MIEGTGPGRGTPWWRWNRPLTLMPKIGILPAEPKDKPREGRTVAKVPGKRK